MTDFQVNKAVVSWNDDLDAALQTFPTVIATTVSFTKFGNAIILRDKMIKLLAHIKNDYENLMLVPEGEIMGKYALNGRKVTIYYATFITIFASLFVLMPFSPIIMDIIIPLNETRKRKLMYDADYTVDEETYYVPIMIHELAASVIVMDILIAVDAMFMVYVQHACGLFAVVSYRMKYLHMRDRRYMEAEEAANLSKKYTEYEYSDSEAMELYDNLKWAIKMHQNAFVYSKLLESSFTVSMAIQVTLNIICISVTGIQFVINMDNPDDATKYLSFLAGQLDHLFFLCLPGQRLLNYSEAVHTDACAAAWYAVPKRVQTLYKEVLLRSSVPCKMTAGKITTLCMETFLGVTQTAVSYFTVLSSMR